MNKIQILSGLFIMTLFVACGDAPRNNPNDPLSSRGSIGVQTSGSGVLATTTYTLPSGTVVFKTIQTTADSVGSGITFPTGTTDVTTATITVPFVMAETLTTYELWSTIYAWAINNGYTFANPGQMGSDSSGNANTAVGAQQPVTKINWRDAMVWCNALTEYYNTHGGSPALDCVYYTDLSYMTPLRTTTSSTIITNTTTGSQDDPYIKAGATGNLLMANCTAKGFRLPTSNEYEYAARYRGSDNTNAVLMSSLYWTKGNSASGATTYYNNTAGVAPNYFGRIINTNVAVYGYYWDGTGWPATGVTTTAVVKSKIANTLGLYDMSGNAFEFCFDWYTVGSYRVSRGGSFFDNATYLQVGFVNAISPDVAGVNGGFRFSRTK
jgi:formylglycine-generating enzyme